MVDHQNIPKFDPCLTSRLAHTLWLGPITLLKSSVVVVYQLNHQGCQKSRVTLKLFSNQAKDLTPELKETLVNFSGSNM